ncbi:hypothetical protein U9M48_037616 [Paspalum notatum var. saurae]|uniref:Uncharacterized protein n=1 Tax=Paspalum notatum var. saurae TaxID=547442 RepID=A0AAQ3UHG1_PASNO
MARPAGPAESQEAGAGFAVRRSRAARSHAPPGWRGLEREGGRGGAAGRAMRASSHSLAPIRRHRYRRPRSALPLPKRHAQIRDAPNLLRRRPAPRQIIPSPAPVTRVSPPASARLNAALPQPSTTQQDRKPPLSCGSHASYSGNFYKTSYAMWKKKLLEEIYMEGAKTLHIYPKPEDFVNSRLIPKIPEP